MIVTKSTKPWVVITLAKHPRSYPASFPSSTGKLTNIYMFLYMHTLFTSKWRTLFAEKFEVLFHFQTPLQDMIMCTNALQIWASFAPSVESLAQIYLAGTGLWTQLCRYLEEERMAVNSLWKTYGRWSWVYFERAIVLFFCLFPLWQRGSLLYSQSSSWKNLKDAYNTWGNF